MPVESANFMTDRGFGQPRMFQYDPNIGVQFGRGGATNTGARFPKQNVFSSNGHYLESNPSVDVHAGARTIIRDPSYFINPNSEDKVNAIPVVEAHRISENTEKLILFGLVIVMGVGFIILLNRK